MLLGLESGRLWDSGQHKPGTQQVQAAVREESQLGRAGKGIIKQGKGFCRCVCGRGKEMVGDLR